MPQPDLDQYHLFLGQTVRASDHVPAADQDQWSAACSDDPLRFCVLGSGSGGNCSVVGQGQQMMLIDAGFGPRATVSRLERMGVTLSQIRAICLTHLDADHYKSAWVRTLIRWRIPVYLHERHMDRFWSQPGSKDLHDEGLVRLFTSRAFSPIAGWTIHSLRLTAHDAQGCCAFRIHNSAGVLGYATDLGHVPDELIEHFAAVDLLAIESNYDVQMQLSSSRPWRLKQRIMGGQGHLSNEQCLDALRRWMGSDASAGPSAVVLLHRSRQCNCPNLLRSLYDCEPRIAERLTLSDQYEPTPWITISKK
jgi:phosphoribosyl 1,2-cyclic phosphodiesterase